MAIRLNEADLREGLALERKFREAHDLMHAAQAQVSTYMTHLSVLYKVPEGWQIYDWKNGFTPPSEAPPPHEEDHHHG